MQKMLLATILCLSVHSYKAASFEEREKERAAQAESAKTKASGNSHYFAQRVKGIEERAKVTKSTPLMTALFCTDELERLQLAQYFLEKDPSLLQKGTNPQDSNSLPFFYETTGRKSDVAHMLLDAGADINQVYFDAKKGEWPAMLNVIKRCVGAKEDSREGWFDLLKKMLDKKALTTTKSGVHIMDKVFAEKEADLKRMTFKQATDERCKEIIGCLPHYDRAILLLYNAKAKCTCTGDTISYLSSLYASSQADKK